MKITEKDIFNFVRFPDKLNDEKKRYIRANIVLFEDSIKLCAETAAGPSKSESPVKREIQLEKLASKSLKNSPEYYLAADSINMSKSTRTETFMNAANDIVAKAIFYNDKTKIFILSETGSPINNFKLTIKPSEKSYLVGSINEPLELPAGVEIESMRIEI